MTRLRRKVVALCFSLVLCLAILAFAIVSFPLVQPLALADGVRADVAPAVAGQPGRVEVGAMQGGTGSITGIVTNLAGVPMKFIRVSACDINVTDHCEELYFTGTEGDDPGTYGTYSLNNLPPGQYKIRFKDFDGDKAPYEQYYDDAATIAEADPVTVNPGATTEGIDAKLMAFSHITGRVLNSSGFGIPGIQVLACDPAVTTGCTAAPWTQAWAETNAGGYYDLKYALQGTYKINYSNYVATGYLEQFYNNKYDFDEANTVTVGIEGSTALSDTTLVTASNIQGTVKDVWNQPIEDAHLLFVAVNGSVAFGHETDISGSYLTRGMPAGLYTITVTGPDNTYLAKQIIFSVDEGEVETLDVVLEPARKIHGYVTEMPSTDAYEGAYISACPAALDCTLQENWDNHTALSQSSGHYEVGGLTAGEYYVRFDPLDPEYLIEYHANVIDFVNASFVFLTGSTYEVMINAEMDRAPAILGQVTARADDSPIQGISVTYCRKQGDTCPALNSTVTDSTGNYTITALLPGTYLLKFDDFDSVQPYYLSKVYNADSEDLADATEIVLANSQVTGVNVQMVRGASLFGTLLLPGGAPALGARVGVCQVVAGECTQFNAHTVDVDSSGAYTLTGLRNGINYRAQFLTPNIQYLSFYPHPSGSAPVFAWQSSMNLNLAEGFSRDMGTRTFPRAGTISGRVTNSSGAPIQGIKVRPCYINLGDPCTIGGEVTTNGNGEYTIQGRPPTPPDYYIRFVDDANIYKDMYYGGAVDIHAATPVTLAIGENRTGISIALPLDATTATPTPTGSATPAPSVTPSVTPTPTPLPTMIATLVVQPNAPAHLVVGAAQGLETGQSIQLEVPAGAVDAATIFSVGVFNPPPPKQSGMGSMLFAISATQGGSPSPGLHFGVPVTVTITYRDVDVAGLDEENLTLHFRREGDGSWSDDGIVRIAHDLAANRLTVTIAHLTTFALFDPSERELLPLIVQ